MTRAPSCSVTGIDSERGSHERRSAMGGIFIYLFWGIRGVGELSDNTWGEWKVKSGLLDKKLVRTVRQKIDKP